MTLKIDEMALQAEHQKLARLLGCSESDAARLDGLDVDGFRKLRAACTARLYDGDRAALHKLVSMSAVLPIAIKALISEKAMGPVLASRVAGLLPPKEAAEIAKRVPLEFNVQVTLLIDPRSAVEMIRKIPVSIVVDVTRELVRQGEIIVMARFVDALTDEQIKACTRVIDDESLLKAGLYIESAKRLDDVVRLMSDEQISGTVGVAAKPELDLGGAVLNMLNSLGLDMRARLIDAALTHKDVSVGEHLVGNARELGMLDMLASVSDRLSDSARARMEELA